MSEDQSQNEINVARSQGRFEGEVLGALQDIKATVGEFKQSFRTHAEDDSKKFDGIERKIDDLKKFVWMISGGLVVAQIALTYWLNTQ